VGDFDPKQLDAWVDKYFAPIAKPSRPLPRVSVKEPPRKAEARLTEYGRNDLPAVGVTYLAPRQADPDAPALYVADAILSAGESSRLYNALVYTQQLAAEVNSNFETREDVSLFVLTAVLSEGKKAEDAEKSLLAEIKKLAGRAGFGRRVGKAKNQIITTNYGNVRRVTARRSRWAKQRVAGRSRAR
jgi:zinc protease